MAEEKRISLIVPVYYEEEVLPIAYPRMKAALEQTGHDYEILFVNDGSRDGTMGVLRKIAAQDKRVKVLSFSRNFGHQLAVTAGMDEATGDALVINETKVIPARLLGVKEDTGVPVEVLLLRRHNATDWEALVRPGRRLRPGTICSFGDGLLRCEVLDNVEDIGGRIVRFHCDGVFEEVLDRLGEMPLPPYIHEKLQDANRYQTVYAKQEGSAAAPTAGLHFTPELLERI